MGTINDNVIYIAYLKALNHNVFKIAEHDFSLSKTFKAV